VAYHVFHIMVAQMRSNRQARQQLLEYPERVLNSVGLDKSALNEPHDKNALARAEILLSSANITDADDAISALKKLGAAARNKLGENFEVEVDPFGVTLL